MGRWDKLIAWILGIASSIIYLLTMEPSVSFWDCGEFIATSQGLQVEHPPGAPTYNLLAHCLMLMAGGNIAMLAWWSNALSAIAGGATVGFLYATIVRMTNKRSLASGRPLDVHKWSVSIGAAVGSLCYLFCDTAWFSATESEVYSLATLFAAVMVWAAVVGSPIYICGETPTHNARRWVLLIALIAGLSVGVHLMALLALPAVAVILIGGQWKRFFRGWRTLRLTLAIVFFFAIGFSTYCIVPIRAAAKPEICYGDPSTKKGFASYVKRDQYAKAPLWPRSWRMRPGDEQKYASWRGKGGDVQLLVGYQMGYMYFRYLMWNFCGRFNDRQGFGGLQNGQFITGIPPLDALIVGSGKTPPQSIGGAGHNRYFMLPLILGIVGAIYQCRRHRKAFYATLTLFLMGGIVLGIYMNHPIYEPRERDYAYILSFYAFSVWIAFGAIGICNWRPAVSKRLNTFRIFQRNTESGTHRHRSWGSILLLVIPGLMAWQNWDDHDRSGRFIAYDTAANILNSCDSNAILITYGDNDTFPLWYAQQVEGIRKDVTVANVNLRGGRRWLEGELMENNWQRPVYFSNYMRDAYGPHFKGHLQLEGMCFRLCQEECDTIGVESFYEKNINQTIHWHNPDKAYIDPVGRQFIEYYWRNVLLLAERLVADDEAIRATNILDHTYAQLPTDVLSDKRLIRDIAYAYRNAGQQARYDEITKAMKSRIAEEQKYYNSIRTSLRQYVTNNYTLPSDFWND